MKIILALKEGDILVGGTRIGQANRTELPGADKVPDCALIFHRKQYFLLKCIGLYL